MRLVNLKNVSSNGQKFVDTGSSHLYVGLLQTFATILEAKLHRMSFYTLALQFVCTELVLLDVLLILLIIQPFDQTIQSASGVKVDEVAYLCCKKGEPGC